MSKEIKCIVVFIFGGDVLGMNVVVRAVVCNVFFYDMYVYGICRGYEGMIDGDLECLECCDVGNIIYWGGMIFKIV